MSDFADLLGKLETTAKKARAAPSSKRPCDYDNDTIKSTTKSKRQKSENTTNQISLPRDANDLSIQVSFMGIGAQKAGTSWLYQMLNYHPNLSLPKQKEVHFWDWHRRKGLRWYSQQFLQQRKKEHKSTSIMHGEITPCYAVLEEKHICEIRNLFPNLKIMFIARDLVDRAWSALLMELRNNAYGLDPGVFAKSDETLSKRELERVERESNPDQYNDTYFMDRLMHSTHSSRSDYAKALRLWLKWFPKEQILILNYNDLSEKPHDLLKDVCRHLKVEDHDFLTSLDDDKVSARVNVGRTRRRMRPSLLKKMKSYFKPISQDFNELLKELGYEWKVCDYSGIEDGTK